jgi:uncharacterized RDD family membrane protein YckC
MRSDVSGDRIRQGEAPVHGVFSPDGVHLELPISGPAPRIFAYAIDFVIILFLIVLVAAILFTILPFGTWLEQWLSSHFAGSPPAATAHVRKSEGVALGVLIALFVIAQFVIETGYFIFWEMVTNGRSPGKAVAGLRVICRDGMPLNFRSSVIRNVMRIVDILPENYAVGLISLVVSENGQRLGDHAAGTLVIRLDRPEAASEVSAGPTSSMSLTRQQIARLGPREIQLLRGTLRRAADVPEDRSEALLLEVAEALRARMELPELPSTDPFAFLQSVLMMAERYSRLSPRS